jgi:hypothetical protein
MTGNPRVRVRVESRDPGRWPGSVPGWPGSVRACAGRWPRRLPGLTWPLAAGTGRVPGQPDGQAVAWQSDDDLTDTCERGPRP